MMLYRNESVCLEKGNGEGGLVAGMMMELLSVLLWVLGLWKCYSVRFLVASCVIVKWVIDHGERSSLVHCRGIMQWCVVGSMALVGLLSWCNHICCYGIIMSAVMV